MHDAFEMLVLLLLLSLSCLTVVSGVKFVLVSPNNNTQAATIVSFKARLSYRDEEYIIPQEDNNKSPPATPMPLHICFHTLDINQCAPIPPLEGNIKVNLGIQQNPSNLTVVDVVLCQRRGYVQSSGRNSKSTSTSTSTTDNGIGYVDVDVDVNDVLPIESMEECLAEEVEDSLSLHLHSPSFHNDLPAHLMSGLAAGGGGEEEGPVGGKPVAVLISTLNPSSSSTSSSSSATLNVGDRGEDLDLLQSSLLSYLLSMSNDVYVIVPDTSVCDSLSAISVTCCALSSPELCIPVVADLAMLYVAAEQAEENEEKEGGDAGDIAKSSLLEQVSVQRLVLAALSRVRGRVLIASPKPSMKSSSSPGTEAVVEDTSSSSAQADQANQMTFLESQLPPLIYQTFQACAGIGFPPVTFNDGSGVFKERSSFVSCQLRPLPSGARGPSHRPSSSISNSSSSPLVLPFSDPSTASFSFNNGINLATLTNVCLAENKKELYLIKNEKSDNILSAELRDILKLPSSGFYPFDTIDANGGWVFSEVTADELNVSSTDAAGASGASGADVSFYPGVTALSSPAFAPQMIHTAQTVFPLLQAGMHPELYPWINRLERVMFPTVSRYTNKWVLGLISMLTSFSSSAHSPAQPTVWPSIYLKEDVARAARSSLLCFESVVVLGHIAMSSPFISSPLEASAFQNHLIGSIPSPPSPPPPRTEQPLKQQQPVKRMTVGNFPPIYATAPVTATASTEKGHSNGGASGKDSNSSSGSASGNSSGSGSVTGGGMIRITVACRGSGRRLLNLEQVLSMLKGTHGVDAQWLAAHVVDMELLSFQQQMQLMQETDIYISGHDAGLLNHVFMKPHSAVIEIFTAPWFEVTYQCTALAMNLHYFVLPQTRMENSFFCKAMDPMCLESIPFSKRGDFRCLGLRDCSVRVDVDALQIMLFQAIQAVKIKKHRLSASRLDMAISDLEPQSKDHSYEPYRVL